MGDVECAPCQVLRKDSPTAVKRESGASPRRQIRCCPRNGKQVRTRHNATGFILGRRHVKTCEPGYRPGTNQRKYHGGVVPGFDLRSFSQYFLFSHSGMRGRLPGKGES